MKLFLVRHGQTDWNVAGRYQGQCDVPLNSLGEWQAQQIAGVLAGRGVVRVVCSDLQRAVATAWPIANICGVNLTTDSRWRELSFGQWEGLTYAEIMASDEERFTQWAENPIICAPPGGETLAALSQRVEMAWQELYRGSDETIVLVAHGGSLQLLLCHLLGLPETAYWQFKLEHGSLSQMQIFKAGAVVVALNDVHHLALS